MMTFRPLEDRLLIRRVDATEVSKGGIIIPETVQEKPQLGVVVYAGPGIKDRKGDLVPMSVKPGDEVLFGKWSGDTMDVGGEKLLLLREPDILGIMA